MKFSNVLSAGLLAAVLSTGAAHAAGMGYSPDGDVLDGTMDLFNYMMTDASTSSLVEDDVDQPSVVPLPAAGWLLLAGVAGLAALRRRTSA